MRAYHTGDLTLLEREVTIIAGENRPGEYGLSQAEVYATELASKGHTIMLILSAGVPLAAADAVHKAGYPYVSVLTSGLERPTPPHMERAHHRSSLVLAPEPGTEPSSERRRNMAWDLALERCDQVVLVDARPSFHAEQFAWHAIERGVPLYGVPGPMDQATSVGVNRLIATGDAQAITNPNMLARGAGSRAQRGTTS